MATVGAIGGSQIDVQGLASQLVAVERAPLDQQLQRDSNRITTQISAVGTLMGALSQFRTALASLKTTEVFSTRQAVSADETVFKASASARAAPGDYSVEVVQLASAHQISSAAFADGADHEVGSGTLTISLGDEQFEVVLGDEPATLAEIRDAINAASDNPGVRATLVHASDGSRLVLTSAQTGAANVISVTTSGGDGGLASLAYSGPGDPNYTELAAAQDAIVHVANAVVTSETNTVSGAIDGVTLTLLAPSDGAPTKLTVSYDRASVTARVNNFVNAYNALVDQISRLRSYDPATRTAGPMLGDSLLSSIESQLRRAISEPVAGADEAYATLASVGITTQANGKLAVDAAKLDAALSADFEAAAVLFGSEDGVAAKLFAQMEERLATDGALDTRSKNLVQQQKALQNRKDQIDARMEALYASYVQQFTRLDTLLSQLQVTSSYLTQQIESLGNLNKAASR